MANIFTGGSTVSVSRPLDRIFDDAQHTGEVILCGRKLKEYPKIAGKYDLVDTVSIDLSKNRFTEIPPEIFEYRSAECLNCYYNAIKFVPEALLQLQNLTHLCLSPGGHQRNCERLDAFAFEILKMHLPDTRRTQIQGNPKTN